MSGRGFVASMVLLASACGGTPAAPATVPPPAQRPDAPATTPPRTSDAPPTRRDDVVETLHGVAVHDPYRWLEDASNPEVQAWMTAQDRYARERLARVPGHDALAKRLTELLYFDARYAPKRRGDRFFFTQKRKDGEKVRVVWKQGERGAEQVLLDPAAWAADGSATLVSWWPSEDGRYVAYNRTEHNADEAVLEVVDVATGKPLADRIPGTKYTDTAQWTPDGRGFYYEWLPPLGPGVTAAERPGLVELRYHRLGSDPVKDPTVRAATHNPESFLDAQLSADGHWLVAYVAHGWNSTDVYVQDLRARKPTWTTLVEGVPSLFIGVMYRDTFYVRTNDGASRFRVIAIDPRKPARAAWTELVPESDATLDRMELLGGRLVLHYLRNAASEVAIHDLRGKRLHTAAVPPLGTVEAMVGRPDDGVAYFQYTSYTEAAAVYEVTLATGAAKLWSRAELAVDTSAMETEQVRYPSSDGAEITMFLIHKKGAAKTGRLPTLLTGYGGFASSETPEFSIKIIVWLERGGMVAIPNLRGGGEYGEDWHKAGMLLHKQHVFDDFLNAARYLGTSGWTSPDYLVISGASNGGLLTGAAVVQAPQLFRAARVAVPLLDMVRYHRFGSGRTWVPEYGSAEDPAQFAALYAYSPYHHVVPARYPAVLLASSDHDDRVDPMHARKFAAALQAATTSDAPVYLRIQRNSGHGGTDLVKDTIDELADEYAFLMAQVGLQ